MITVLPLVAVAVVAALLLAWHRSLRRRERERWITEDAWRALERRARGTP